MTPHRLYGAFTSSLAWYPSVAISVHPCVRLMAPPNTSSFRPSIKGVQRCYRCRSTAGGVQEPSVIGVLGQYARTKSEKSALAGAGSQFAR